MVNGEWASRILPNPESYWEEMKVEITARGKR